MKRSSGALLIIVGYAIGVASILAILLSRLFLDFYIFLIIMPILSALPMIVARALMKLGRRMRAVDAETAMASDARPPVLYLRSFADDDMSLLAPLDLDAPPVLKSILNTEIEILPFGQLEHRPSFEESLFHMFSRYGPVVTIGRPGEPLPLLGAARKYVPDDEWQKEVKRLIGLSRIILVLVGATAGLSWEINELAQIADPRKVVLVFPPVVGVVVERRWKEFQRICSPIGKLKLPEFPNDHVLFAIFDDDWACELLTRPSKRRDRPRPSDYILVMPKVIEWTMHKEFRDQFEYPTMTIIREDIGRGGFEVRCPGCSRTVLVPLGESIARCEQCDRWYPIADES
jgi:hypothetical protein